LSAALGNDAAMGAGFGFAKAFGLGCSSSDSDSELERSSASTAAGLPANWRVRTGCAVSFLAFGSGIVSGCGACGGVECTKLHVHQNLGKRGREPGSRGLIGSFVAAWHPLLIPAPPPSSFQGPSTLSMLSAPPHSVFELRCARRLII
jgi:hypothetical protein